MEFFLLITLILSLVMLLFSPHRGILFLVMLSAAALMIYDQMRWQPWVYLYFLMIIAFFITPPRAGEKPIHLNYLRIIITGVYFWSGIHKINPGFLDHTYREILTRLLHIPDRNISDLFLHTGYVIPIIEIAIAIALWTHCFRNKAVVLAISSHIFILLFLSPLGINANTIVYPWNLAMIVFMILLFWNDQSDFRFWPAKVYERICIIGLAILTWILPATNFFGFWDNYLSFSLYSDKASAFYIAVEEKEISKIDDRLKRFFVDLPGISGGRLIDINEWAMSDLGVPVYPERRVFEKIAATFCDNGIEKGKIVFLEFQHPVGNKISNSFTCEDLVTEKIK
jgi:hypothetical protein